MGNDGSKLKGVQIDKTAVEANDFWTLFNAELPTTSNDEGRRQLLSIFQGEAVVNGQLWRIQGPLERAIKNYMIYRHPYILKYVATWEQGGQKHLATERVRPLNAMLASQSDIQMCLGLRTILCSLIFLVEKAMARHLNICISSIYITDNGSWRLAGFEYVWKSKEVTKTLLDLAKAYRYPSSIDPHEAQDTNSDYIEQYGFATFCEEVLMRRCATKSDAATTPHVHEFREYCATHLKHTNAQLRPQLSAVLLHPYFNHEFVLIHSFLFELPLKSVQQRQDFFTSLIDRLRQFNEDIVGTQLVADLLSRMVLLDPTAQLCVTPYVLRTRTDHPAALFSQAAYVRHVMPHVQRMFRLRDAQIRLILLEYFMEFIRLLTQEDIMELILPHLLAGMNDTNDVLVAKTLRCLADLVPILGAATVIGGQRLRLFSDGRPQAAVPDAISHWVEPRSITPVMGGANDDVDDDDERTFMVSGSPLPPELIDDVEEHNRNQTTLMEDGKVHFENGSCNSLEDDDLLLLNMRMPARLSPDGGEDDRNIMTTTMTTSTLIAMENHNVMERNRNEINEIDIKHNAKTSKENNIPLSSSSMIAKTEHEGEEGDEEIWSDWEEDELQRLNENQIKDIDVVSSLSAINQQMPLPATPSTSSTTVTLAPFTTILQKKTISDDLSSLDIQVQATLSQKSKHSPDEFDFFKDMQPIIHKLTTNNAIDHSQSIDMPYEDDDDGVCIDSSRFAALAPVDEITINSDSNGYIGEAATDGWDEDDSALA